MTSQTVTPLTKIEAAVHFFEQIPFNQFIGLEAVYLGSDRCEFRLAMQKNLIGNWAKGILHGGVIASALDVAGGAMSFIGAWDYLDSKNATAEERARRLARVGTIDMRVDYLRPGHGSEFTAVATLLRVGSTVAVTRMDFTNEQGLLIAAATGTYVCG